MIDMRDIVARLQFPQGPEGNRLVLVIRLFDLVFMITLKDLVIRVTDDLQVLFDESFVDGVRDRMKGYFRLQVLKNGTQPFQLARILRKEAKGILLVLPRLEILYQKVKLTVEGRLGAGMEFD